MGPHSLQPPKRRRCLLSVTDKSISEPCEDAGGNGSKNICCISTVKRVLYGRNLKGRSTRKKPRDPKNSDCSFQPEEERHHMVHRAQRLCPINFVKGAAVKRWIQFFILAPNNLIH